MAAFTNVKKQHLNQVDKSRKNEYDSPVVGLISALNNHPDFFTTSSCSGRIVVFNDNKKSLKKGFEWLLVSHEDTTWDLVNDAIINHAGTTVLKFEPMILHIRCSTLSAAQNLMAIGVAAGFRNSGLTISNKGHILLAVRSSIAFEVPLSFGGECLVSEKYLRYVIGIVNEKMADNLLRIARLERDMELFLTTGKTNSRATVDKLLLPLITSEEISSETDDLTHFIACENHS